VVFGNAFGNKGVVSLQTLVIPIDLAEGAVSLPGGLDGSNIDDIVEISHRLPDKPIPDKHESAHWITPTAMCVEVRDPSRTKGAPQQRAAMDRPQGVLYVFMLQEALLEMSVIIL
jgi:hypothetical protein